MILFLFNNKYYGFLMGKLPPFSLAYLYIDHVCLQTLHYLQEFKVETLQMFFETIMRQFVFQVLIIYDKFCGNFYVATPKTPLK